MKRAVWLVFLSVAASLATAQVVELIPKWDDSPSSNPRSNLSLVIEVRNTDTLGHSIVLRPHLPEGWRELVSAFPGHLGPGEAGARIVALFVPQEARAGVYVVEIDAIDAETDQTLATLVVPVEVLPNVDLELTILDGSTYVVVGEVIVLPLRVTNQSNIDLLVTLSQRGRYEFSAWFDGTEDGQIRIPPNESVRLVANLQTGGLIGRVQDYSIELSATGVPIGELDTTDLPEARASQWARVQIIPVISEERPPYNRIPSRLTLSTRNQFQPGWDGELAATLDGSGALDGEGRHRIDFRIAPIVDLDELALDSARSAYRLNYDSGILHLGFGDNKFTISPLLDSTSRSRGVDVRVGGDSLAVSGLYYFQPDTRLEESTFGGVVRFCPALADEGVEYQALLAGLYQLGSHWLAGTYHQLDSGPHFEANLDLALGGYTGAAPGFAVTTSVSGFLRNTNASVAATYGSPRFSGQESDQYFVSGSLLTPQLGNIPSFSISYSQQQQNLLRDPLFGPVPLTINGQVTGRFEPPQAGAQLSGSWRTRYREDLSDDPDFDTLVNTLVFDATIPGSIISYSVKAQADMENDFLAGATEFQQTYSAGAVLPGLQDRRYSLSAIFASRRSTVQSPVRSMQVHAAVSQTEGQVEWNSSLETRVATSDGALDSITTSLAGAMSLSLGDGYSVDFTGSVGHTYTQLGHEFRGSFAVTGSIPLEIPVSRQRDVGGIAGTVIDARSGLPIQHVIVRLADRAVVTGESGAFGFTGLAAGDYYLEVDASRVGTGLIADRPTPIQITVTERETSQIDIPLVRGATVRGRIVQYELPTGQRTLATIAQVADEDTDEYTLDELVETGGLAGLIIYLRRGDDLRRVLSRDNGVFEFNDVRPGEWTVGVEESRLPRFHRLAEPVYQVDLQPGDTEDLQFHVVPKRRPLTVITAPAVALEVVRAEPEPQTDAAPPDDTSTDDSATDDTTTDDTTTDDGQVTEPEPDIVPTADGAVAVVTEAPDEIPRGIPSRIRQHIEELRLTAPQPLGLSWGSTPQQVEVLLTGRIDPVELDESAPDRADRITLATSGVVQLGLLGDLSLTYIDPNRDGSELLLVGTRITVSARENLLSQARLYEMFVDLVSLFVSRWKVEGMEIDQTDSGETRTASVSGIDVVYRIDYETNTITLEYSDRWFGE